VPPRRVAMCRAGADTGRVPPMEGWRPAVRSALTLGAFASGARRLPMITRLRAFWVLGAVVLTVVIVPVLIPGEDAGTPKALGYGLVVSACVAAVFGVWWMGRIPAVRLPRIAGELKGDQGRASVAFTIGRATFGSMLCAVAPYAVVGRLALEAPILAVILGPATFGLWVAAAPTSGRLRRIDARLGSAGGRVTVSDSVALPWEVVFTPKGRRGR
jgi:hypothetical protein